MISVVAEGAGIVVDPSFSEGEACSGDGTSTRGAETVKVKVCTRAETAVQGYLAHKKPPPPRTLRKGYLGPYGDPRGGGCFL
jgi:hypothetical protein